MRRVLPFFLLLVLVASSAGGAATGLFLGKRARDREAAEKERLAVAAYKRTVTPIVTLALFHASQILTVQREESQTRRDVLLAGTDLKDVTTLLAQLTAVPVPRTFRVLGQDLARMSASITQAVTRIEAGARKTTAGSTAPELRAGYASFTKAYGDFLHAIDPVIDNGAETHVPDSSAPSRANYVRDADHACLDGIDELFALGKISTVEAFQEHGKELGALLVTTIDDLLALKGPPDLAGALGEVNAQLRAGRVVGQAVRDELAAVEQHDLVGLRRATAAAVRAFAHLNEANDELKDIGASWCGPLLRSSGTPGDVAA